MFCSQDVLGWSLLETKSARRCLFWCKTSLGFCSNCWNKLLSFLALNLCFAFDQAAWRVDPSLVDTWQTSHGSTSRACSAFLQTNATQTTNSYYLLTMSKTSKAPQPPQPLWLFSAFCLILACPLLLGIRFLPHFSKATRICLQIGFLSLFPNIGSAS